MGKRSEGKNTFRSRHFRLFEHVYDYRSVLVNIPSAVEQHVKWASDCVGYLQRKDMETIEATVEVDGSWNSPLCCLFEMMGTLDVEGSKAAWNPEKFNVKKAI